MAKWLTLSPVVAEFQVRIPAQVTFHLTCNFFHKRSFQLPNTKTVSPFVKLISKEEMYNNFEIRNNFMFHLITVGVLFSSTDLLTTYLLTSILIVTDCHHS